MNRQAPVRVPELDLPGVPLRVTAWHAATGARVVAGDRLVEIHAGEAVVDLPAPASGQLLQRLVDIDEPVRVGQTIAWIETRDPG